MTVSPRELSEVASIKRYFSTRDLLMMAAMAALGGVTSTYVNAIGDLVHSVLGFAGTTQWAAGLHVLWLTLAMGLVGRAGTGTITGILKGVVELLSGNTHGVLVLLVDVVAGLLVDLAFVLFRRKDTAPAFALAGGLAAASNVLVFQLFAALPVDILAYGAILVVGGMAFASGVVFAGILGWSLLNALRRAGAVRDRMPASPSPAATRVALAAAALLTIAVFAYVRLRSRGPEAIAITGAVDAPYAYPTEHGDIEVLTVEATLREATSRYEGVPLNAVIQQAKPRPDAAMVLVQATDGYAFFITMDEVANNESLILSRRGEGEDAVYNIVGAESSKAWVRGVTELTVVGADPLPIEGNLGAPSPYRSAEWQHAMDSALIDLADGTRKLQGAPLRDILSGMRLNGTAESARFHTSATDTPVTVPLVQVMADEDVRVFTIFGPDGLSYAIARTTGEVIAEAVVRIEVR